MDKVTRQSTLKHQHDVNENFVYHTFVVCRFNLPESLSTGLAGNLGPGLAGDHVHHGGLARAAEMGKRYLLLVYSVLPYACFALLI